MQKQDAVIRRIEIIGEATAHLSDATRQTVHGLPFRKMRGMAQRRGPRLRQRGFKDRMGGRYDPRS
jgi:hypothetical protein